jgi:hypothetical protein
MSLDSVFRAGSEYRMHFAREENFDGQIRDDWKQRTWWVFDDDAVCMSLCNSFRKL